MSRARATRALTDLLRHPVPSHSISANLMDAKWDLAVVLTHIPRSPLPWNILLLIYKPRVFPLL